MGENADAILRSQATWARRHRGQPGRGDIHGLGAKANPLRGALQPSDRGVGAPNASKGLVLAKRALQDSRNRPGRYRLVALLEPMEATHTGSVPLMLPASRPLGQPDIVSAWLQFA
jgi:hypothetical protein